MVGLGRGESGLTMLDQDALGNPPKSWFWAVAPPCLMCLQLLAAACNACLIMAELTVEVEMICKNHLIRTRTMRINAVWFAATYPTVLIVHWVPWSVWGFHYARCWATLDLLLGKHWKAIFWYILIYFAHHGAVQIIFVQVCRPSRRFTLWK